MVTKINQKTSEKESVEMTKRFEPPASQVKTITFDNSEEFAGHRQIDESLDSAAYYTDDFANCWCGLHENFNRLSQLQIPKKRRFPSVLGEELKLPEFDSITDRGKVRYS